MNRSDSRLSRNLMDSLLGDLSRRRRLLVAFSGGVDSTLVAALAHTALGNNAVAVTVDSPLLPSGDFKDALRIAQEIGIEHVTLELNELALPDLRANPPNRCYLCKRFRLEQLTAMAAEHGFAAIADGTSASDITEYRPGLQAATEMGAYSPLLDAGLSKRDARLLSEFLGLSTSAKPSSPCLATRIPYGGRLDKWRLQRIDTAERAIRALFGIDVLRVRDHGDIARVEIETAHLALLSDTGKAAEATKTLKELGWRFVTLDLEGYRAGSFDGTLNAD